MATLTETFTNIANSIRLKTETTDKITPENMPSMIEGITTGGNVAELSITSNGTYRAPEGIDGYTPVIVNVPQDGAPPASAFVIEGDCSYRFANDGWNWFIKQYGNQITTKNISKAQYMFKSTSLVTIPFDINMFDNTRIVSYMFDSSTYLTVCPKINYYQARDMDYMFNNCWSLREIPSNFSDNWDWDYVEKDTSSYNGNFSSLFRRCYSLRKLPEDLIKHCNPYLSTSYTIFNSGFDSCYVLDEIIDLPVPDKATWTSNAFSSTFVNCNRLKRITFITNEDGTPKTAKWKSQLIELGKASNSYRIGYAYNDESILKYNSGLTSATRIYNDETYQALKDNPDNWTDYPEYSRYNKISAIETISTLPDTSAYLAEKGGTNTINFYGNAGSKTDGGAINTMTEEEIAVAVAKGWTVTFY